MARITIDIPEKLRIDIKMLAAREGKTLGELLAPTLEHFVVTHDKKQEN